MIFSEGVQAVLEGFPEKALIGSGSKQKVAVNWEAGEDQVPGGRKLPGRQAERYEKVVWAWDRLVLFLLGASGRY